MAGVGGAWRTQAAQQWSSSARKKNKKRPHKPSGKVHAGAHRQRAGRRRRADARAAGALLPDRAPGMPAMVPPADVGLG